MRHAPAPRAPPTHASRSACILLSPASPRAQRRAASLYSFGTRPFAFRESISAALPAPQPLNPPRARSACVLLSPAPPARSFFTPAASLYSVGTRPFAFRESISRTAASQPSPRTQRLRFTFARPTRAQVIFCKAARAAAIVPPFLLRRSAFVQPGSTCGTHRRPSIFPAHFRKIAPFPVKIHGMPRAFRALRRRAAFPAAFRQAVPFPGMLRPLAAFLARICCITSFPCKKRGVFPFPAPANSAFSPYCAIFSHACRPAEARSPQRTTAARKKAYA